MKTPKHHLIVICVALALTQGVAAHGEELGAITISTKKTEISLGEPLMLNVTYRCLEPVISPRTNRAQNSIEQHGYVKVTSSETGGESRAFPLFPSTVKLHGKEGIEYGGRFVLFYDFGARRLLFDKPGAYTIKVTAWGKDSNPLRIKVEAASDLEQSGLSLLQGPDDHYFLVHGKYTVQGKQVEVISRLKRVVEEC
ncbi:MAG: hypothetical protein ACYS8Z_27355, partial [Planctomycetota bacterium]